MRSRLYLYRTQVQTKVTLVSFLVQVLLNLFRCCPLPAVAAATFSLRMVRLSGVAYKQLMNGFSTLAASFHGRRLCKFMCSLSVKLCISCKCEGGFKTISCLNRIDGQSFQTLDYVKWGEHVKTKEPKKVGLGWCCWTRRW